MTTRAAALPPALQSARAGGGATLQLHLHQRHDHGASRSQAAKLGGVTVQIVRDWVLRFNAEGPSGLIDRKAPGKPAALSSEHRAALAAAVEAGPRPYLDGVVRWRLVDLAQLLWDDFRISVSRQTLGRELRAMGYRKISARPQACKQDPDAMQAFKRISPPS